MVKTRPYKLAIVHSHPIQYSAPLYRHLAKEPLIDLTVFYCSRHGITTYYDAGFDRNVQWDVDLLGGYEHEFLPGFNSIERLGSFFSHTNPSIVTRLKNQKYDAVLINGRSYATYLLAAMAAKVSGARLFLREVVFSVNSDSKQKKLARKLILSNLYKIYDRIFYIGSKSREYYMELGVSESKLAPLPYAVNNEHFLKAATETAAMRDKIRSDFGASANKPIILFVGKLIKRKRVLDLLQAFLTLQQRGIEAVLLIIGDGKEAEQLKKFVAANGLANVNFLGFVNQSELPIYYGASDIFAFPTSLDPWGAVINEAMLAELPVISTKNAAAAADLVKQAVNGYTYDAGDVEQLASFLEPLVLDSRLRKQMGEKSLEIIGDWSYATDTQHILDTLKQC